MSKHQKDGPSKHEIRELFKKKYLERLEDIISYEEFDQFETKMIKEFGFKKPELMALRQDALEERARRNRGGADVA